MGHGGPSTEQSPGRPPSCHVSGWCYRAQSFKSLRLWFRCHLRYSQHTHTCTHIHMRAHTHPQRHACALPSLWSLFQIQFSSGCFFLPAVCHVLSFRALPASWDVSSGASPPSFLPRPCWAVGCVHSRNGGVSRGEGNTGSVGKSLTHCRPWAVLTGSAEHYRSPHLCAHRER